MASTPLFDGPFTQPLREADRFQGFAGTVAAPNRAASGNLSDNPPDNPVRDPKPFKNLTDGRR